MKQLQWDKLPQQQAAKTVFSYEEPFKEEEWVRKLQTDGVWMEMEEDFKAKQLVINLMGASAFRRVPSTMLTLQLAKQKRAELKSVLDPQTKKRVGTLGSDVGIACSPDCRRDSHSNRQEASAGRDRHEDQALRPGYLYPSRPERTQARVAQPRTGD